MRRIKSWQLVALAAVTVSGSAYAVEHRGAPAAKGGEVCPMDDAAKTTVVLRFLHTANQDEIKGSKMAAEKAQAPEVKQFAERMVKEHTEADQHLMDVAKKQNIDLTVMTPSDPIHAALNSMLESTDKAMANKTGPAFDAAYVAPQAMSHELLLDAIEQGQKTVAAADVKALLNDMHRVVAAHAEDAHRLADRLRFQSGPVGGGPTEQKGQVEPQAPEHRLPAAPPAGRGQGSGLPMPGNTMPEVPGR